MLSGDVRAGASEAAADGVVAVTGATARKLRFFLCFCVCDHPKRFQTARSGPAAAGHRPWRRRDHARQVAIAAAPYDGPVEMSGNRFVDEKF